MASAYDTWNGMGWKEKMYFRWMRFKCALGAHAWMGAIKADSGSMKFTHQYCIYCKKEKHL